MPLPLAQIRSSSTCNPQWLPTELKIGAIFFLQGLISSTLQLLAILQLLVLQGTQRVPPQGLCICGSFHLELFPHTFMLPLQRSLPHAPWLEKPHPSVPHWWSHHPISLLYCLVSTYRYLNYLTHTQVSPKQKVGSRRAGPCQARSWLCPSISQYLARGM